MDDLDTEKNGWTVRATLTFAPIDDSLAWVVIFAHSLWLVGYNYGDPSLLQAGMARHGKLVRDLSDAIRDENKRCHLDTLAAINNIGMLAITRTSVGKGGVSVESPNHTAGLQTLMGFMQPQTFQNPNALAFLEYIRFETVIISMLFDRACLLASNSWKTIPWAISKHGKNSLQKLLDILCDIIPLQSKLSIMSSEACFTEHVHTNETQQRVVMLLSQLRDWRQSIETDPRFTSAFTHLQSVPASRSGRRTYLYELCIFNMMLIYLCGFLSTGNVAPQTMNLPAIEKHTGKLLAPKTHTPFMPVVSPMVNPIDRAKLAAKEILLVWGYIVQQGITASDCIYLTVALHVARQLLLNMKEANAKRIDEALQQIARFWTGKK